MPNLHDKIIGNADLKKIHDPKVNLRDYEEIPPQAVASAQILMKMRDTLGRPESPFIPSGEKLMSIIIAVWEDGYPLQAREWYESRKEYQNNEMSITSQVHKHTGRSLASYPEPIYNMVRKLFPGFDPATPRDNAIKMVRKWPMFRMANKV